MRRKVYIQNLSVLSAFAVVALHTNGEFWRFSYGRYWITSNVIESFFYFAVPIFFMITGVTLLDYNEKYSTKEFFIKRTQKTVFPFVIWSLIALIYRIINKSINDYSLKSIVDGLINTKFNSYYWFFIVLFSIYLSIPFLSAIPKEKRKATFGYGIIVAFLFNSMLPFLFSLFSIPYNNGLNIPVISGYLIFVLIGYWIDNYELTKKQRSIIYILGAIGLMVHIFGTWFLSYKIGGVSRLFKGYFNIPSLFHSVAVFTLFKYMKTDIQNSIGKITKYFSSVTFGIYLTHWFVLQFIINNTNIQRTSITYRTLGAIIIFLVCSIIVNLIQKIPILNKIVPK